MSRLVGEGDLRVEGKKGFVTKASQGLDPPVALHYQKDFSYDKAGNRASYQHQNGGGQNPSRRWRRQRRVNFGMGVNFYPPQLQRRRDDSYTYDMMGRLTQIQDSGRSFTATITNDMNGNIIEVSESWGGGPTVSTFSYDNENRLTEFTIGLTGFSAEHTYDGFNRLIKTNATTGGNTTNYEHTYAGKRHLGNIDVTNQEQPVNGKVWRWESGAGNPSADPIECPQRSSASGTQYYMLNDERTIEKRSYQVGGVVAGDTNDDSRYAEWQHVNGAPVPTRIDIGVRPSELFSAYAITLDADRASSAATNHALQLGATDLEYEVTRVKSPVIGRDMNPMGRGNGAYYPNGGNVGASIAIRGAKPRFIGERAYGYGNNINNQCGIGMGVPGLGEFAGEIPEIPIHPWDEKDAQGNYTQIELYPTGNELIKYKLDIARLCVWKSNWVYNYTHGLHEFCMDTCMEKPPEIRNAHRFAAELKKLCKTPHCHVALHHLPRTLNDLIENWPYRWGVIVAFSCPNESETNVSPLIACVCRASGLGAGANKIKECLDELMVGHGPKCQGWSKADYGDDGHRQRVLSPDECTDICTIACLGSIPVIPPKWSECNSCCALECQDGGTLDEAVASGKFCAQIIM